MLLTKFSILCFANLLVIGNSGDTTCDVEVCDSADKDPLKREDDILRSEKRKPYNPTNYIHHKLKPSDSKHWEDAVVAAVNIACLLSELTLATCVQDVDLDLSKVSHDYLLRHSRLKPATIQLNGEAWKAFSTASRNMESIILLMVEYLRAENSFSKKIGTGISNDILSIHTNMMKRIVNEATQLIEKTKNSFRSTRNLIKSVNEAFIDDKYNKELRSIIANMQKEMKKLKTMFSSMGTMLQQLTKELDLESNFITGNENNQFTSKTNEQQGINNYFEKLKSISRSIAFVATIYSDISKSHVMNRVDNQISLAVLSKNEAQNMGIEFIDNCKKSIISSRKMIAEKKAEHFSD